MLPATVSGQPVTGEGKTGRKTENKGIESTSGDVAARAVIGTPTVLASDTDIFYLSIWLCLR